MGMLTFIRNHKIGVGASAVAVLAGMAWLAFGYFGVHTLFVDDVVDEAGPVFDTPAIPADEAAASATEPSTTAIATDEAEDAAATEAPVEAEPATETTAVLAEPEAPAPSQPLAPATTAPATPEIVTEFTGQFAGTSRYSTAGVASVLGNGTDQRFLRFENFETDNGPDLNVYLFDDETGEFVDLGDLKGNIGDQNYEIPADVDLERFDRVSIWCVRFGVSFGSAELMTT